MTGIQQLPASFGYQGNPPFHGFYFTWYPYAHACFTPTSNLRTITPGYSGDLLSRSAQLAATAEFADLHPMPTWPVNGPSYSKGRFKGSKYT
jgi:hypothetical protein